MSGFHVFYRFDQLIHVLEVINIDIDVKSVFAGKQADLCRRVFKKRFTACSMALYVIGGMFDILEMSRNRLISSVSPDSRGTFKIFPSG